MQNFAHEFILCHEVDLELVFNEIGISVRVSVKMRCANVRILGQVHTINRVMVMFQLT